MASATINRDPAKCQACRTTRPARCWWHTVPLAHRPPVDGAGYNRRRLL